MMEFNSGNIETTSDGTHHNENENENEQHSLHLISTCPGNIAKYKTYIFVIVTMVIIIITLYATATTLVNFMASGMSILVVLTVWFKGTWDTFVHVITKKVKMGP